MNFFFCIILSFCSFTLLAQRVSYTPEKINSPIKVDGKLEEKVWQSNNTITNFTKSFPDFGNPPTKQTTVRILYDNDAIYVAAILFDDPKNIRKQLTQRDIIEMQDADNFSISFDTYQDRQNAFSFRITAAGVQGDSRQGNNSVDVSWDAVWESAVTIQKDGWHLEMKIPLSAIRFAKSAMQNWGMQIGRFIRSSNENITWSPQNPNLDGTINQWGDLTGLANILPPVRLSFLPYVSSGIRNSPTSNGRKEEILSSGGMDVKYGINESFTLDMTLIPDFAQVQSDNVFLNLSPFQVRFDDFRPFFTEGTELFNKAGLFYSRRIGAEPSGVSKVLSFAANNNNYEIKKNPGITRLINATKFSGRNKRNLGIGLFNALTAPMEARLTDRNTKRDTTISTEALTNYNVFVLDKALKNRSSITFTNTNVLRKGNNRNANVSALDISLYDKTNAYSLNSTVRYSKIWGKNGDYDGYTSTVRAGKVGGKWQYQGFVSVESDRYDPNDLGFLQNNNSFEQGASFSLQYNLPTRKYLTHRYSLDLQNTYLYKPFKWQEFAVNGRAFFLFRNFWDVSINFNAKPAYFNDFFEARTPGLNLKRFSYAYVGVSGSSDSRKKLFVSYNLGGAESKNVKDDPFYTVQLGLRYRFSPKFQLSANVKRDNDKGQWGYSHRDVVSTLVAGFNDPIIAFRKLKNSNLVLNAQYSFTPRMNWTIRMRHNWTYIDNRSFHKLRMDGSWDDIAFVNGRNRNFNVFNVDMFYTWDFKWGSRLTFGWKNALGSNVNLDPYIHNKFPKNFTEVFNNPHSNEITLKIVYFLDYLNFKKKS